MNANRRPINPLWFVIILLPVVSVVAALLVIVATSDQPASVQAGPTATPVDHPLIGEMAPNFELPALDGGSVRLSSLRGRVVFVNFWATWCEPCRREFPAFETFSAQQNQAVVLAVNVGETAEQIVLFLDEVGAPNVRVLLEGDQRVSDEYRTNFFPSTFVIDPAGVVIAFHLGEVTLDDLNHFTAAAS